MEPLYEKPSWTNDAKSYETTSAFFSMVAFIIGALGILTAIVWFFLGLTDVGDGGLTGIIGSVALGFHSVVLIIFGMLLRLQSKVLLSVFEMSLGQTRKQIQAARPKPGADEQG